MTASSTMGRAAAWPLLAVSLLVGIAAGLQVAEGLRVGGFGGGMTAALTLAGFTVTLGAAGGLAVLTAIWPGGRRRGIAAFIVVCWVAAALGAVLSYSGAVLAGG